MKERAYLADIGSLPHSPDYVHQDLGGFQVNGSEVRAGSGAAHEVSPDRLFVHLGITKYHDTFTSLGKRKYLAFLH